MKRLVISLLLLLIMLGSYSQTEPVMKIGLVADPQYADKSLSGKRYYRESLWKLKEAIVTFNENQVDFVQNLGDIIDVGWKSYDSILPLYQDLGPGIENYHLLGNHDFSIPQNLLVNLLDRLSMPDYYYAYEENGWKFIVLDATDYAYFSMPLHEHDKKVVNRYMDGTIGKPNNHSWNSAIGEKQQKWLKKELKKARKSEQKVILFSHAPLRPLNIAENLWNNLEIIDIIEDFPNVVAFVNGHNHAGNYVLRKGIHYITICGMVDTNVSSYGILEIFEDKMVLKGFGNQRTIQMNLDGQKSQRN